MSSSGRVELGAAASKALAGSEDVGSLIEALGTLMDMHATLQVGCVLAGCVCGIVLAG